MKSVNLIPAHRRAAKCRRAHFRRCAVGCAVWGVLSLGAAAMCHTAGGGGTLVDAEDRLSKAAEEIDRTERAIATVRRQLDTAQSTLRANQAIANQPDWSILLAILGQKVGDEVVLRSCRVRPADARSTSSPHPRGAARPQPSAGTARPAGGPGEFVLEISGMAKSTKAASAFVLTLDNLKLFARVTLLDTSREPFFDSDAIAFKLECSLEERPAPAPGAAAQSKSATAADARRTPPARGARQSVTSSTAGEQP